MKAGGLALFAASVVFSGAGFGAGWYGHARTRRVVTAAPVVSPSPVVAEDTNRDGHPDRWVRHDGGGRVLNVSLDTNHDGRPDRVEHYGVGNRVDRIDFDENFDGQYDRFDSITTSGHSILTHYDANWNDLPERWVQRGSGGEVVSEWTDANEDLAPEHYREFSPLGRLTEEGIDADGDGLYEEQRFYNVAWGDRQPAIVEHDRNADGLFESRQEYDRAGHVTRVMLDSDNDGERDQLQYLTLDGRVYKEGHDRNGDGLFEEWRFPVTSGGVRVGHDDDTDHDIDRWDPPGPPPGWCAARCVTATVPSAPLAPR